MNNTYLIPAVALLVYMLVNWLIALTKRRLDVADVAWGIGFILISWLAFFLNPFSWYGLLANTLITIWGARLSFHIYLRNQNREEDFRYKDQNPLKAFLAQGFFLYLIALPILSIHANAPIQNWMWAPFACSLWLYGFLMEAKADGELAAFIKDPNNKGRLLETGTWKDSRHPNYFGEIVQWWAIWMLALPVPHHYLMLISPLLITFLIVRVSGIVLIEDKMNAKPGFQDYVKKTPALVPYLFWNSLIYLVAWMGIVFSYNSIAWVFVALLAAALQTALFFKTDKKSFSVFIPLSLYSIGLGIILEMGLIHFGVLQYHHMPSFPPLWLLSLYPLFSMTLNSSLSYLNKNIFFASIAGGIGAMLSYRFGEAMGALTVSGYPWIILAWGLNLAVLLLLNRKLLAIYERDIKEPITVIFDKKCPMCSLEMKKLQTRKQIGPIHYACPVDSAGTEKIVKGLSYQEAMKTIHAVEENGKVLKGTDALSALYARTDLNILAVLLQAPVFKILFQGAYAVWAYFRIRAR